MNNSNRIIILFLMFNFCKTFANVHLSHRPYHESDSFNFWNDETCLQPLEGRTIPYSRINDAPLMKEYGSQRIFVQALSSDNYFASILIQLNSLDIINKDLPIDRWKCGNNRFIIFHALWFDPTANDGKGQFTQIQNLGIANIDYDDQSPFKISNVPFANKWSAKLTPSRNFIVTNKTDLDRENVNIKVSGISLIPQGTIQDNQNIGPGFVPTNNKINAFSFSNLNSKIEGNIGKLHFQNDAVAYVESVYTTTRPTITANFACIYLLQTNQDEYTLFVCGNVDGTFSYKARGMIMNTSSNERIWLAPQDFQLKPIGPKYWSDNAKAHFNMRYQITIPGQGINISIVGLKSQKEIDFGAKTNSISRWTQEVKVISNIKASLYDLSRARGMMELSKTEI
ncbi:hypothetical protein OAB57_03900 [Bacteriovoracaceae bacterium]|nr:hypothetical protein [Bacteriovoracaceae bacterium]